MARLRIPLLLLFLWGCFVWHGHTEHVLEVPDFIALRGFLFESNVSNILPWGCGETIISSADQNVLPEWISFDPATCELAGIPHREETFYLNISSRPRSNAAFQHAITSFTVLEKQDLLQPGRPSCFVAVVKVNVSFHQSSTNIHAESLSLFKEILKIAKESKEHIIMSEFSQINKSPLVFSVALESTCSHPLSGTQDSITLLQSRLRSLMTPSLQITVSAMSFLTAGPCKSWAAPRDIHHPKAYPSNANTNPFSKCEILCC
jgi:hypothetical protein